MTKGERLRALRENAGLTLEDVAERLFITRQAVYKYEKDIVSNIPSNRVEALAKLYNTTPEYILGWDVAPENTSKKINATVGVLERMEKDKDFADLIFEMSRYDSKQLKRLFYYFRAINDIKE